MFGIVLSEQEGNVQTIVLMTLTYIYIGFNNRVMVIFKKQKYYIVHFTVLGQLFLFLENFLFPISPPVLHPVNTGTAFK